MPLSAEELEALDADISGAVDPNAMLAKDNLVQAADGNPDQYAADLKLGQETGYTPEMAGRNRPQLEKLKYLDELDLKALDAAPATQEWVKNPQNAKVAYDDLQTLIAFERESNREWYDISDRAFEGLGDSMMIGMGKSADEAAILVLNEMKREGFTGWGDLTESPAGMMAKLRDTIQMGIEGEDATKAWNDEIDRKIESHKQNLGFAEEMVAELTPEGLTVLEEGLRGGVQMVADMAPGMAVTIGTRGKINMTLPYLTGKTYLSSYGSGIMGGLEHDTAKTYATIDAALEYATERIPTKRLEGLVGELGGTGVKSSIKRWLVGEATGEQIATATQSLNAYAFDLDEQLAAAKDWGEVVEIQGRRQAVTFISTLTGGGGIAGSIKTIDYLANRERRAMGKVLEKTNKIRGSGVEQDRLDSLIHLAQSAKTNERAADQFADFMNTAAPDQTVYMGAEAVDLLSDPPQYLLDQIDGSGGNVAMPLSDFLRDFANDETSLELVRPHIKTKETLSTQAELEEDADSDYIKTLLAKANEATETKTAADAIYEKITRQLVATGRQSAATARQSATLIPAQVTTQYEYLKSIGYKKEDGSEVTLEELFADFGLEVVGPEVDVQAEFMTQEEASELDQAVAKGLPVDKISRETRAVEQGFDIEQTMYHGTQQKFDAFDNTKGLDGAHFFTGSEAHAATFGEVSPYYLKLQNPLEITQDDLEAAWDAAHPEAFDAQGEFRDDFDTDTLPRDFVADFLEQARQAGNDGLVIRGMADVNLQEDVFIPLDESQIRSTNAAFDPDFSASPRVLAQQNLGTIELTETRVDAAGNVFEVVENAGALWDAQQDRLKSIDQLRNCVRG